MSIDFAECITAIALLLTAATALVRGPRKFDAGSENAHLTELTTLEWGRVACAVGCRFPAPP